MPNRSSIEGDLSVSGTFRAGAIVLPADAIGNDEVGSADPITTDKMYHRHHPTFADPYATTAVAHRQVLHVAHGDGTLLNFDVGLAQVIVGGYTCTIDLLKNGTSVLSSVPQLTSAEAARELVPGTINPSLPAYVAEDVFEVSVTVGGSGTTQARGVFARGVFDEEASP